MGELISAEDAAARFRAAVEAGDPGAFADLFAPDIRLHSPVKFTPFEGRDAVLGLFEVLLRTFEGFHYVGEFDGGTRTRAEEPRTPAAVLVFRASVRGKEIHGIDMLQFAPDGRIQELTVMVRPQSAVQVLGTAVLAGLQEAGQVPGAPETDATGA